ncbi:MAG: lysozyme inhibitor LprI family protein [Pseudomonadota bacterium]
MIRPFLAFVCLAFPAAAQEVDCANPVTQMEMNQCAYDDWEAADADLNTAYQAAMRLLRSWDDGMPEGEKGGAEALKQAQRAWITFRDKACEAEGYAMKGGSAEPLLVYGCMRLLTEERTGHLTSMVEAYAD